MVVYVLSRFVRHIMRYIVGILVALGLVVLLIVLLVNGGGKSSPHPVTKKLYDYASTDAQVSLTIDGPINAESLHQQVRITVDNTDVTYEQLKGYQGNVVNTQIFANNEDAYNAFLHALYHAGFSLGSNNPALKDESGYCPTGDRYIFEMTQDGNTLERYWSTSCGNIKTYEGSTSLTLTLFQAQVPNYSGLTENVQL